MNILGNDKIKLNSAKAMLDKVNDILLRLIKETDGPNNMDVFIAMLLYRYLECLRVSESEEDDGQLMNLEQAKIVLQRVNDIALDAYKHLALRDKT